MRRVLIVDNEPNVLSALMRNLKGKFDVELAQSGAEAEARLHKAPFDAVLCDLIMPGVDGLSVLSTCRKLPCPPAFVLMTGYPNVQQSLLTDPNLPTIYKPIDPQQLLTLLERAMQMPKPAGAQERQKLAEAGVALDLDELTRAAQSHETILVRGETGVGKSRLARCVHDVSPRAGGPFVIQSCAELSSELALSTLFGHTRGAFTGAVADAPGAVEAADGGTLFLDEIGELHPAVQAGLLRFLSERSYQRVGKSVARSCDVRIIAATNRDLEAEVQAGRFRADLYYRIRVIEMSIRPLRERPEDLARLVRAIRKKIAREQHTSPVFFSQAALRALERYPWPGNVRELENLIRKLGATKRPEIAIEPDDLDPPYVPAAEDADRPRFVLDTRERLDLPSLLPHMDNLKRYLEVLEYRVLLEVLREEGGSRSRVARRLGYERPNVYDRLKKYARSYGTYAPLRGEDGGDPRAPS